MFQGNRDILGHIPFSYPYVIGRGVFRFLLFSTRIWTFSAFCTLLSISSDPSICPYSVIIIPRIHFHLDNYAIFDAHSSFLFYFVLLLLLLCLSFACLIICFQLYLLLVAFQMVKVQVPIVAISYFPFVGEFAIFRVIHIELISLLMICVSSLLMLKYSFSAPPIWQWYVLRLFNSFRVPARCYNEWYRI